jgi:hypothetical protein
MTERIAGLASIGPDEGGTRDVTLNSKPKIAKNNCISSSFELRSSEFAAADWIKNVETRLAAA